MGHFFYLSPLYTYRMGIPIESIVVGFGYFGIFGLMIANGFFSVPSSQILYIIVGYFVSTGALNVYLASVLGAVGNTIGNVLLYEAVRSHGLKYVTKYQMIPAHQLKKVSAALERRGRWFVFLGKLLPAIKVFVPVAAGLAKMPRALFAMLMLVSSWLWALGFIAIGYFFGKSENLFGKYAIVVAILSIVLVILFHRYLNSREVIEKVEGI